MVLLPEKKNVICVGADFIANILNYNAILDIQNNVKKSVFCGQLDNVEEKTHDSS